MLLEDEDRNCDEEPINREFSLARVKTIEEEEEEELYSSITCFVVTMEGRCFVTVMFSMDREMNRHRHTR